MKIGFISRLNQRKQVVSKGFLSVTVTLIFFLCSHSPSTKNGLIARCLK